jgi:LPS export ABC transporter protein LptC
MRSSRYISQYILTALAMGCFCMSACENDVKKVDELLRKKTGVEEATKIESFLSQDGTMKAKLTAPYMLRYIVDSPYIEFPRTLHVDFYDDTAKVESTLDARYAKYTESERKVYLRDSIRVINILKGDTLKTQELWWDQNKQEFYTDKDVEIREKTRTIYGKGLRAAQNFSEYTIYKIYGTVLTSSSGILE